MSKLLTKADADQIKKDASDLLRKLHDKPGRSLGHLVEGTGNYAIRKGDAERAVAALHRTHDTGVSRQIRKVVKPEESDASRAIALMHSDRRALAEKSRRGAHAKAAAKGGALSEP